VNKKITLSKIHESPRVVGILIGLCIALLVILVRNNGGLQFLDLESYDLLLSMKASNAVAKSRVVLVSGSEQDIQTLGEWPMSDLTLNRVFERLTAAGARAIGLDIYRDMPIPPGSSELQQTLLGNDRIIVVKKFGSHDSPGVKPPAFKRLGSRFRIFPRGIHYKIQSVKKTKVFYIFICYHLKFIVRFRNRI
jgi:adenylate cyclase